MIMKNKIVIIGAGGQGRVCADIARLMGYAEVLFLDDGDAANVAGRINDYPRYLSDADFFVAIGNGAVRRRVQAMLEENGANIATLIHPTAVVARDVPVGRGTAVMAYAVVNPGASVGCGNIINTYASVDHDCVVGDYLHIAVGARICGTVRLEDDSFIGAGSVIIQGLRVCAGCMIGAGAVVVKSITEKGTYVGVPARKVK